jgi:hypothetical protein
MSVTPNRTIRQRIKDYIYDKLKSMTKDGLDVWQDVMLSAVDDIGNINRPCVGFYALDEENVAWTNNRTTRNLQFVIEFRFAPEENLDVYDLFEYYLGLLQAELFTDHTLGGLAYHIQELSNVPRIVSLDDPSPGGDMVILIQYTTSITNPYTSNGI